MVEQVMGDAGIGFNELARIGVTIGPGPSPESERVSQWRAD